MILAVMVERKVSHNQSAFKVQVLHLHFFLRCHFVGSEAILHDEYDKGTRCIEEMLQGELVDLLLVTLGRLHGKRRWHNLGAPSSCRDVGCVLCTDFSMAGINEWWSTSGIPAFGLKVPEFGGLWICSVKVLGLEDDIPREYARFGLLHVGVHRK